MKNNKCYYPFLGNIVNIKNTRERRKLFWDWSMSVKELCGSAWQTKAILNINRNDIKWFRDKLGGEFLGIDIMLGADPALEVVQVLFWWCWA